MTAIRLAAWKKEEGDPKCQELLRLGFQVVYEALDPGSLLQIVKKEQPAALVIDLDRSPAAGRDVGVAVRIRASTRHIPLVFAGGTPEKIVGVRKLLPDAGYGSWEEVGGVLRDILDNPPTDPVVPDSALAGYSGTPLPKKLNIKAGECVLLVEAPDSFRGTLGPLPEGVQLVRRFSSKVGLILWFVTSRRALEKDISKWVPRVGKAGIWIIWPKLSSGVASDLRQGLVRTAGLDSGLVDYKIAAIDDIWSGLKFALRLNVGG